MNTAATGTSQPVIETVVEIPRRSKEIDCAGCGRSIVVGDRVCFAYCAKCSENQGKKK